MLGALRWLENEFISQTGRRLAEARFGDRIDNGLTAPRFFTRCYGVRSSLVHGSIPCPTFNQVNGAAGVLESFVPDLLTAPFLGAPQ